MVFKYMGVSVDCRGVDRIIGAHLLSPWSFVMALY